MSIPAPKPADATSDKIAIVFNRVTADIPSHLLGVRSPLPFIQAAMLVRDYNAFVFRSNGLQYGLDDLDKAVSDLTTLHKWELAFARRDYLIRCDRPDDPFRVVKSTAEQWAALEHLLNTRVDTVCIESEGGETQFHVFKADVRDSILRYNVDIAETGCKLARAFPCAGVIDRSTRKPFSFRRFAAFTETPLRRLNDIAPLLPKLGPYVPSPPIQRDRSHADHERALARQRSRRRAASAAQKAAAHRWNRP